MKTAYRAQSLIDAQLIKDWLEHAGIEAEIQGQYLQGGIGQLPTMDLVKILVTEEDLDRAREEVLRWERKHLGPDIKASPPEPKIDPVAIILVIGFLIAAILFLLKL